MRDHSQYVRPTTPLSFNDLVDHLKALAKFSIPEPGFDRDDLMRKAGCAQTARNILRKFFPHIEEDPEHVL